MSSTRCRMTSPRHEHVGVKHSPIHTLTQNPVVQWHVTPQRLCIKVCMEMRWTGMHAGRITKAGIAQTNRQVAKLLFCSLWAYLMCEEARVLNRQHPSVFISLIDMAVPPAWWRGESTSSLPRGFHGINQLAVLVDAARHSCVHTCAKWAALPAAANQGATFPTSRSNTVCRSMQP